MFREGAKDRILEDFEDEGDLVEIIGISVFPNSPCIPYQGKILSLILSKLQNEANLGINS